MRVPPPETMSTGTTTETTDRHARRRDPAMPNHTGTFVEQAIRRRTSNAIHALSVEVNPREIVLHGRCETFYQKQLAQSAAMSASPDMMLTNAIEVQ